MITNATPFFLVLHKHSTLKVLICLVANSISPPTPILWGGGVYCPTLMPCRKAEIWSIWGLNWKTKTSWENYCRKMQDWRVLTSATSPRLTCRYLQIRPDSRFIRSVAGQIIGIPISVSDLLSLALTPFQTRRSNTCNLTDGSIICIWFAEDRGSRSDNRYVCTWRLFDNNLTISAHICRLVQNIWRWLETPSVLPIPSVQASNRTNLCLHKASTLYSCTPTSKCGGWGPWWK